MGKKRVNIRCSPDTVETVEQYADDNDISNSEAYRRCIREGVMLAGYDLDAPEQHQPDDTDDATHANRQTGILLLIGCMGSSAFGTILTLGALGVL